MRRTAPLGQHFLTSQSALAAICKEGDLQTDDVVLEIGPGRGVLTEQLLLHAKKIIAVEKDAALVSLLRERYSNHISQGRLDIIQRDILDFELGSLTQPYKVIANIPYYITGAILEKFLSATPQPERMVLLVQREIAERIVARSGRESILSLSVKLYGNPRIALRVPRGAFSPPPKVDSAVLVIEHISRARIRESGVNEQGFFTVLKHGFAHPRKLLRSNLKITEVQLAHCGIAENARAENVTLEQWLCLAHSLS